MTTESPYAQALDEFESGHPDKELRARALVKANGDESKVKTEYIKLRVAQLQRSSYAVGNPGLVRRVITVEPPLDDSAEAHRDFVLRAMGRVVILMVAIFVAFMAFAMVVGTTS